MPQELENQIEAILFASGKGVSVLEFVNLCEAKEAKIKTTLKKLQHEYSSRHTSLQITHHEDKWKLTVKGKYVGHIEKLVSETELPSPILKTLAIVAFKSPVLQSEIIDMRGQGAYEHIKRLTKENFVTKESHGRSYIIKITEKFYSYFDVEGDEEIRDVFSKLKEHQTKKLGELDVIDIAPHKTLPDFEKKNEKIDMSTLEVVDVEAQAQAREEKKEAKTQQKEFLSDIDSQINKISERMTGHEKDLAESIPKRDEEESDEDPLKSLEEFAEKEESDKKESKKKEDLI